MALPWDGTLLADFWTDPLQIIAALGSLAAVIGAPIAIFAIFYEGRRVRRELERRAQVHIELLVDGRSVWNSQGTPVKGAHGKERRHASVDQPSAIHVTVAITEGNPGPVEIPLSVVSTNRGERSGRQLLWNYTLPQQLVPPHTMNAPSPKLEVRTVSRQNLGVQVHFIARQDTLNPGVTHEDELLISLPRDRLGQEQSMEISLSQEDQPSRRYPLRIVAEARE